MNEQSKSLPLPKKLTDRVVKCKDKELKTKLLTLIRAKGISQSEFYHLVDMSRQVWYQISWGKWKPTTAQKIKIAQALGVDSALIWE